MSDREIVFDPESGLTFFHGPGGFTELFPMGPGAALTLRNEWRLDKDAIERAAEGIARALDIPFRKRGDA